MGLVALVGLVFAGAPGRLAHGTTIAGVEVGGLTPADARALLERRSARLATVPMTFTAGSRRIRLTPRRLGITVDWAGAVARAQERGSGFGVIRGYRRLQLRLFPRDVTPRVGVYGPALGYEVGLLARALDASPRNARLVRIGLHISTVPGASGRALDQAAARRSIVAALASFSRAPVSLPVRVVSPRVTAASLATEQQRATLVVAAPVTVVAGATRLRIPRWRLATILRLPTAPDAGIGFSGAAANAYFARLERSVEHAPRDAGFAVLAGGAVRVVPARPGIALDLPRSVSRILSAALRPAPRVATLAVSEQQPARSTAAAQAMGITGTVGAYETFYGGDPNRIHNVQLVARLVDDKLIAPGTTFSFNGATGERSAAKGFLEAPVIINGEVQNGLGGGVCQVSTTVFNAAYEAGLPITDRTNHALYISHYPLGRDATVNYPDVDLKFVNDTGHWLLLRTFVGSDSLTVGLYGTPQHRRVESIAAPLRVVAPPPVQKTVDPALAPGTHEVVDEGVPAQATSVERKVYSARGALLSDSTWYSSYRSQPRIVHVGPPKPKPAPKKVAPVPAPGGPH